MKEILKAGRNCMAVSDVERTGLLIDGRDFYRAFYRAALQASRYILIAGWQFDSNVALLRGDDAAEAESEVLFLPFLNSLCEQNPSLHIYMLAWDFNVLYSMDREKLQEWLFNWTTNDRIKFKFDSRHAVGASHHQKFVVIDGKIGFAGGMDICSNRWDDRLHLPDNPERRNYSGDAYEQYHDIQSFHLGPLAGTLKEVFVSRWRHAGGPELSLPDVEGAGGDDIEVSVPIEADKAALSRTQSKTIFPPQENIREIRALYLDALDAAEELIYLENQYFSSQAVYKALIDRMEAPGRPPLRIIMVLPKEPHTLLENVALGIAQAKMLRSLKECASRNGHSAGIYYTAPRSESGAPSPTYIHAKLLLVDDRFLSVGSANTNNRSMGLDTELNVSWEAGPGRDELIGSIRAARVNLLAEHCGLEKEDDLKPLREISGIVGYLNSLADDPECRLRHHSMKGFIDNVKLLKDIHPDDLSIDPERPILEENIYDLIPGGKKGFFAGGISLLNEYFDAEAGKGRAPGTGQGTGGSDGRQWESTGPLSALYRAGAFLKSVWYVPVLMIIVILFILWRVLK